MPFASESLKASYDICMHTHAMPDISAFDYLDACAMPAFKAIPGIVENEETLDVSAGHLRGKGAACLPAKDTEPACWLISLQTSLREQCFA